jgi:hypothetical protein
MAAEDEATGRKRVRELDDDHEEEVPAAKEARVGGDQAAEGDGPHAEAPNHSSAHMAPPTATTKPDEDANWAVDLPPDVWALLDESRGGGVIGALQLMRVCRASRAGAKQFLSTLPGLVVCGGIGGARSDVLRLDLATMRWEPMPALVTGRYDHARCAVRGALVVLGGQTAGGGGFASSSVEELSSSSEEGGAFADLPPLSCGKIHGAVAVTVDESDSAAGQVLLLGGINASSRRCTW